MTALSANQPYVWIAAAASLGLTNSACAHRAGADLSGQGLDRHVRLSLVQGAGFSSDPAAHPVSALVGGRDPARLAGVERMRILVAYAIHTAQGICPGAHGGR